MSEEYETMSQHSTREISHPSVFRSPNCSAAHVAPDFQSVLWLVATEGDMSPAISWHWQRVHRPILYKVYTSYRSNRRGKGEAGAGSADDMCRTRSTRCLYPLFHLALLSSRLGFRCSLPPGRWRVSHQPQPATSLMNPSCWLGRGHL